MMSSNVLMFWEDFVPDYHHVEFGGNWTTNEWDTEESPAAPIQYTPARLGPNVWTQKWVLINVYEHVCKGRSKFLKAVNAWLDMANVLV